MSQFHILLLISISWNFSQPFEYLICYHVSLSSEIIIYIYIFFLLSVLWYFHTLVVQFKCYLELFIDSIRAFKWRNTGIESRARVNANTARIFILTRIIKWISISYWKVYSMCITLIIIKNLDDFYKSETKNRKLVKSCLKCFFFFYYSTLLKINK